jgi:hypothetical protein
LKGEVGYESLTQYIIPGYGGYPGINLKLYQMTELFISIRT